MISSSFSLQGEIYHPLQRYRNPTKWHQSNVAIHSTKPSSSLKVLSTLQNFPAHYSYKTWRLSSVPDSPTIPHGTWLPVQRATALLLCGRFLWCLVCSGGHLSLTLTLHENTDNISTRLFKNSVGFYFMLLIISSN